MRASLPMLGLAAAAVTVAAVYVSGRGPDNAGNGPAAASAAATVTDVGVAPGSAGKAERHNTGKLAAFVYKSAPEPVPAFPFFDKAQQTKTVGAFEGKVLLLNLWATWCGPCREEMPSLDRLQKDLGSDKFEVVAVSVDKNGFDTAKKFLDGLGVKSLNYYSDPSGRATTQLKALGMPATLLVDKNGHEIGRLMGPAEWDSPDAKRLIEAALR